MELIRIILDTNFFFVPFDFNIDIFKEFDRNIQKKYQLITFPPILNELKNLGEKKSSLKWKKRIQFAQKIAEKCEVLNEQVLKKESIDDFILRIAKKNNWIVATNDKHLKKKLRQNKVKFIYLRQKTHLILEDLLF
ncbi:MAG: type II toxin-antitoxin system VapC family toxin [Candidatus Helarchaeota archaeon]